MEGPSYDLLIKHGHVLCMDAAGAQHPDGFVAVNGADIAAAGPMASLPEGARSVAEIDAQGCAVLPGFINAHTHLPMSYFRGMADDLPLLEWLERHIWPAEAKYLNPEFVYEATLFAAAECLKSGVTCVNDMYLFAHDVARACADAGLRGFIGEGVINQATPSAPTWRDGVRLTREMISGYAGHPLITPTVCAHAPYTCSADLLQTLHGLAEQHGLLFHTHLSETFDEADRIEWGQSDESATHAMQRIGVLGPRMIAAHCVWVDDHDLHHMFETGCAVAHCPSSNLKLGSGIAPVHSMVEAGVAVGIGTDGAASNNNLNLWEELHLSALLAKGVYKNPEVVPALTALGFATQQGAAALGAPHIGVLAPGKRADITIVELDGLHLTPRYPHTGAVASHLVYAAQMSNVRDTIVHGQVLLHNRQLTRLDEAELKAKAQAWVAKNF